MYLRKVREGKGAKKSNMEPVWITCDDLNAEGILVRCSAWRRPPGRESLLCSTVTPTHQGLILLLRSKIWTASRPQLRCSVLPGF